MPSPAVANVVKLLEDIDAEKLSEEDRLALRKASNRLFERTSTAWDVCMQWAFEQPAILGTVDTFIDLDIFEAWGKQGGADLSVEELAGLANTEVDRVLLARLLRVLAAVNVVERAGKDKYAAGKVAKWLSDPLNAGFLRASRTCFIPSSRHMPQFLQDIGYRNNVDPTITSASAALNWKGTIYEYFAAHPAQGRDFHNAMITYQQSLPSWTDTFPTETLLPSDGDGSPVLVDVGGGTGQMLLSFAKKHNVPRDQLINQDRAEVIGNAIIGDYGISMAHNFFEDQPVKGARAYFLSNILHNYGDEESKKILLNVKSAMKPGSKILLFEVVLDPDNLNINGALLDILMMSLLAAKERTYDEWKTIVESVGLKFTKVHYHPLSPKAVIEIDL